MEETKQNKLPPIIVDFIQKLNDPNTSVFTRDLYASNLEAIRDAATAALELYTATRTRKTARR